MVTLDFSTEEVYVDSGWLTGTGVWEIREYMHATCETCGLTMKMWLNSLGVGELRKMKDHECQPS